MLFKWQAERPLPAPAFGPLLCLASVILMVVVPFLEGVKYALPLGPQTTYGLVFALFICSLMSWKSSPLVNPVIIWIGKVSYSAYFIHFAVLYYFAVPRVSGNAVLDYAIFYAIAVSITVALSSVTYWLIEQPMIRLGGQRGFAAGVFPADGRGLISGKVIIPVGRFPEWNPNPGPVLFGGRAFPAHE